MRVNEGGEKKPASKLVVEGRVIKGGRWDRSNKKSPSTAIADLEMMHGYAVGEGRGWSGHRAARRQDGHRK
jgi:hypothetical protein